MFGNGNNQAMQFMVQGYSDSIKANDKLSLATDKAMKNLSGITNDYYNQEATKANTRLTDANTQGVNLQNEYYEKTMDDRVGLVNTQRKAADLAHKFNEDTYENNVELSNQQVREITLKNDLDDALLPHRVRNAKLTNQGIKHDNTAKKIKNYIGENTKVSQVGAINAANKESETKSNLETDITTYKHQAYKPLSFVKGSDGKYYDYAIKDSKSGKVTYGREISPEEAERRALHNQKIYDNQNAVRENQAMTYHQAVSEQNAQHAANQNAMMDANAGYQQREEFDEMVRNSGMSYQQIAQETADYMNSPSYDGSGNIALSNGYRFNLNSALGNMITGNGSFAVNNSNNMSNFQGVKVETPNRALKAGEQIYESINDGYSTEGLTNDEIEAKNNFMKALNILSSGEKNAIAKDANSIMQNQFLLEDIPRLNSDANAFNKFVTAVGQYIPGLNQAGKEAAAKTYIQNAYSLQMAKQNISGAASDRDMAAVKQMAFNFLKNKGYNERIAYHLQRQQLANYHALMGRLSGDRNNEKALKYYDMNLYKDYLATKAIVEVGQEQGL